MTPLPVESQFVQISSLGYEKKGFESKLRNLEMECKGLRAKADWARISSYRYLKLGWIFSFQLSKVPNF